MIERFDYLKTLRERPGDYRVEHKFYNISEYALLNAQLYSTEVKGYMANSISLKYEILIYNEAIRVMWKQYDELTNECSYSIF